MKFNVVYNNVMIHIMIIIINIWKRREISSKQVIRAVAFFVKFGRMRLNAIFGRSPNALAT
jgi:hypothetical protein